MQIVYAIQKYFDRTGIKKAHHQGTGQMASTLGGVKKYVRVRLRPRERTNALHIWERIELFIRGRSIPELFLNELLDFFNGGIRRVGS
ncbi:hypothetical protein [Trueperella abortisuis]|uniref:Uncharacterized protein n=1 Tax=Trueperella abortisuis TaxID=445930 RepID=A0ABT9PH91_9ACTO|nr:hypothetical protein [Trueperella abortisuis]MDP9832072.1 hypothetical protein [Trueperella abortisuis]